MSSAQPPFLDPGWSQLSAAEMVTECKRWLAANPDDEHLIVVQKFLESLNKTILEKDKTILEKDNSLLEKDKTILEKDNSLLEKDKTILNRSLISVLTKFTALVDHTDSTPHFPEKHTAADVIEEAEINNKMSETVEGWLDDEFWRAPYLAPTHSCDSEGGVQNKVKMLIDAILKGLKLDHIIEVVENRTLAGAECDLLLVYKDNRLPFAVVEVKKPGNSHEARRDIFHGRDNKVGNKVSGQVFDQMTAVKLFGFPKVFGMISTWNHWRLVCSHSLDTEQDPKKLTPEAVRNRLSQLAGEGLNEAPKGDVKTSPDQSSVIFEEGQNGEKPRAIYASKIVPDMLSDNEALREKVQQSGKEIVQLVTLFVLKASMTLVDLLDRQHNPWAIAIYRQMPCRVLTPCEDTFAFATVTLEEGVKLDKYNDKLGHIHIIQHLGSGGNGSCCLGVSKGGRSCCVIKFFHKRKSSTKDEVANEELKNWENVYGKLLPKCRVLNVTNGPCLVMPYLHPIPQQGRQELLNDGSIEGALSDFAKSGYIHTDIKWRHLGRWVSKQGKDIYCFIDLGDVVQAKSSGEISSWQEKSMKRLTDSVGEVASAATPGKKRKSVN